MPVTKMRAVVGSEGRSVVLNAGQQLPAERIFEAARQGHRCVLSGAEGAVELGVVDIGANPCPGNMAEGDAIHLVPGSFGVSAAAAAAKR